MEYGGVPLFVLFLFFLSKINGVCHMSGDLGIHLWSHESTGAVHFCQRAGVGDRLKGTKPDSFLMEPAS